MTSNIPSPFASLPSCSKLLVKEPYPPSAPLHLCLSHVAEDGSDRRRALILYCGSPEDYENKLVHFNDAWLNENAGRGPVLQQLLRIKLMYPQKPSHLKALLSLIRTSWDRDADSRMVLDPPPSLVVLVDPSLYFVSSQTSLPEYLSLVLETMTSLGSGGERDDCKFVLFDSRLDELGLPIIAQSLAGDPANVSSDDAAIPPGEETEDSSHLIARYFDWVGTVQHVRQDEEMPFDKAPGLGATHRIVFRKGVGISPEDEVPSVVEWAQVEGRANAWTGQRSTKVVLIETKSNEL